MVAVPDVFMQQLLSKMSVVEMKYLMTSNILSVFYVAGFYILTFVFYEWKWHTACIHKLAALSYMELFNMNMLY